MTAADWQEGRKRRGLRQTVAAQKLGISQEYLSQLENGRRAAHERLARRAIKLYRLEPTALPLKAPPKDMVSEDTLTRELAGIGYPGFAYLPNPIKVNPAQVVYQIVTQKDADARLVDALPWVLARYPDLDWSWLRDQVKLCNVQNRLGYLVHLAKSLPLAQQPAAMERLTKWERDLEEARLANEGTLCYDSMRERARQFYRERRPAAAAHWNLLTNLSPEHLFGNEH